MESSLWKERHVDVNKKSVSPAHMLPNLLDGTFSECFFSPSDSRWIALHDISLWTFLNLSPDKLSIFLRNLSILVKKKKLKNDIGFALLFPSMKIIALMIV